MRKFIYDAHGEVMLYLTGAGALFDSDNKPVGIVQDEQVVTPGGQHAGWFDGAFLWNVEGYLLGFVKGARAEGLELPQTKPLHFKPQPVSFPVRPLLIPREKPTFKWQWSPAVTSFYKGEQV